MYFLKTLPQVTERQFGAQRTVLVRTGLTFLKNGSQYSSSDGDELLLWAQDLYGYTLSIVVGSLGERGWEERGNNPLTHLHGGPK